MGLVYLWISFSLGPRCLPRRTAIVLISLWARVRRAGGGWCVFESGSAGWLTGLLFGFGWVLVVRIAVVVVERLRTPWCSAVGE
jgi:hypothetical protein